MREMESENQDDFMFMRIVAMFKIVITITINKHQVHDVSFYLKGLSLVPSSEGFTITAFLPAYLMYNNCVTHTAKASKGRFEFRQRDLAKNGTIKDCKKLNSPARKQQDDLAALHDFPHDDL